jgi:methylenetetrahydrofolate reductase (NADPH)
MKIIDKILKTYEDGGTTVSFEYFPAKTEAGISNLLNRVSDMNANLRPTFVTLTWRSAFKNENLWLKIGREIQTYGLDVLLHLTCHLPRSDLKRVLKNAREAGIQNILALRGDPPIGESKWQPCPGGFTNAIELVKLIREEHGDYFCVAVACYPEVHTDGWNSTHLPPSTKTKDQDLAFLKEKCDAGADFMISQFFFDVDNYIGYIKRVKEYGINIPILPGYLPIQNYRSFEKFTSWCKTAIPQEIRLSLKKIKDNDEAVKAYGVELGVKTMQRLLIECKENSIGFRSLHFYTMNLAVAVTQILQGLGMLPKNSQRQLPYMERNAKEDVRPIFWKQREASYLSRTATWDEFPNGRWGDNRSPAYGELTDYYLAYKRPKKSQLKQWGLPQSVLDVKKVFLKFLSGKIKMLPWCDQALTGESSRILRNLNTMNNAGFLTINSQPSVNAAPSADPIHGWGGEGGYVFQKAYVEFFCNKDMLDILLKLMPKYPLLSYHARNVNGEETLNVNEGANAVTWGVFPCREIIQPTVVDTASFRVWSEEAFELWRMWENIYKKGPTSVEEKETEKYTKAQKVLQDIRESYYLVNLVDNDYTNAETTIFDIFNKAITQMMSKEELQKTVEKIENENNELTRQLDGMQRLHQSTVVELEKVNEENLHLKKLIIGLQKDLRNEKAKKYITRDR